MYNLRDLFSVFVSYLTCSLLGIQAYGVKSKQNETNLLILGIRKATQYRFLWVVDILRGNCKCVLSASTFDTYTLIERLL